MKTTAGSITIAALRRRQDFLALRPVKNKYACDSFLGQWQVRPVLCAEQAAKYPTHPLLSPPPPSVNLGLVVTKKLGKAHDRNRIKRRLRAAFREALVRKCTQAPDINEIFEEGMHLVLVARSNAKTVDYQELLGHFERMLRIMSNSHKNRV